VCGIARAALGAAHPIPWEELAANYDRVRERIARVVPGCEDMNRRVREAGGFVLPSAAGARAFRTGSGRAHFTLHDPPAHALPAGQLWMMTLRSHDQYNTTVYGNDDRYRGVRGDRRVVFLHADELAARGFAEGERVRIRSHWRGETRELAGFAVRAYDLPRGCAATYFPEANPLVPVDAVAARSGTPAYKSVAISLHRT
jgi:anaerobic selenocysteine-containing dehydrogenase